MRSTCVWQTWQRPTLPRLETKYHQRWSVSRPSSEWDRVQPLRHNHQVGKTHVIREAVFCAKATPLRLAFGRKPASATSASPIYRRPRGASGRRPIRRVSAGQTIRHCRMSIRNENDQADRTISTGKLQALPLFHTRPINVVVFHGSQGILVLRWVSRLDAFSGYPVRI